MQYRINSLTGDRVSLLGFGTMRLPVLPERGSPLDEAAAIGMIRRAIDGGINYIDTAYMYHKGESEILVGKALADGYRDRTFLADKLPVWRVPKTDGGATALLDEQLSKTATDRFDYYLLHSLNKEHWATVKEHRLLNFLEAERDKGRIRRLGFSFHDDLSVFKEIIDAFSWDFCQIQFNYIDTEYQAGLAGLKYAGSKGIPVVVMEPLKGGRLSQRPSPEVAEIFERAAVPRTAVEWGFQYVADYAEVLTILSGMSEPAQLEENLRIFAGLRAGALTAQEHALIGEAAAAYRKLVKVDCTKCEYCLPCPQEIKIPKVIEGYNEWYRYRAYVTLRRDYLMNAPRGKRASDCLQCGDCEERCPQDLPIRGVMREMAELFEAGVKSPAASGKAAPDKVE